MNQARRRSKVPWPTHEQLERAGFVRCAGEACPVWIDPVNVPLGRCMRHRGHRANRR